MKRQMPLPGTLIFVLSDPINTLRRAPERMPLLEPPIAPNAHHVAAVAQADDDSAWITQFLQPVR